MTAPLDLGPGKPGLVSYIIPAYNVEKYIGDMLESCLAEDYRGLELVIVDDGSTDGTGRIVQEFKARHATSDFHIVYHRQENAGPSAARNKGLMLAEGSVLGFLDADDILISGRTTLLKKVLGERTADLAFGSYRTLHTKEEATALCQSTTTEPAVSEFPLRPLVKDWPYLWTFLMHRELAARVGPFHKALRGTEDYEYMTRLRSLNPRMVRVHAPIYLYRIVPGSLFAGSPYTPESVGNRYLATKMILQHVRDTGITERESLNWLFGKLRGAGTTNLRFGLREETIEAYDLAAGIEEGEGRLFCKCAAAFFRLPLAFGLTRAAIHARRVLLGLPRPALSRKGE